MYFSLWDLVKMCAKDFLGGAISLLLCAALVSLCFGAAIKFSDKFHVEVCTSAKQ